MNRFIRTAGLAVCGLLFAAAVAHAQGAAPAAIIAPAGATGAVQQPDGSVVFLQPLIVGLEPYILAALGAVITGVGTWIAAIFQRRTGIQVSQAAIAKVSQDAKDTAGAWFAAQEPQIAAHAVIPIGSPAIAKLANAVLASAPAEIKADVPPEKVATMVAGEIGRLQAQALSAPIAKSPVTPATTAG